MGSQNPPQGEFKWSIESFSRLTVKKLFSNVFTIGGCNWRLVIYPKGNNTEHFSIFLDVPDFATLPAGWCREVHFSLIMVNQDRESCSTKKDTCHNFNAQKSHWGFKEFKPLSVLQNCSNGFLVNDTLIVEVEIDVRSVVPPIAVPEADRSPSNVVPPVVVETNQFESFFSKLKEVIVAAENSADREGSGSNSNQNDQAVDFISGSPGFQEVKKAKQSLKECLLDLFKLNMKDRLSAALLTLTRAEVGLSSDQQKSVKTFWNNFDDFISDFLTFELDNAEFELQKFIRDQMVSAMKKKHETHLSNKQLLENLVSEEEELKKRMEEVKAGMEEVKARKEKLISDWQSLMTGSEEAKSKYTAQEKKLAEAEEKKRIAEERMSRSTAAWSSLKAQFV